MDPAPIKEVSLEVFPYLRVFKDGTIERLAGTDVVPAGFDTKTSVLSKDVIVVPETGVSARIYRPESIQTNHKLPLVVYFHGGAFCIASAAEPMYHTSINNLVAEANVIAVSVNYRLVPENPLTAAYDDSWDALKWVGAHQSSENGENVDWIADFVDFQRVFMVGDSAGANIAHHLAIRLNRPDPDQEAKTRNVSCGIKISGIGMINPYFWGTNPIGSEVTDSFRKEMVDGWWNYVCPSDKGCDDPLINPFVDGSPSLKDLACDRVFVIVAEKDILRDRGKLYYDKLAHTSGWEGTAEIMETKDKDHVFHIFEPDCQEANDLIHYLDLFINPEKKP